MKDCGINFRSALLATLRKKIYASAMRSAAIERPLAPWTAVLTKAAVKTCLNVGWRESAKEHHANLLPISRGEYLALEVKAFGPGKHRWRFPLVVIK